MTDFCPYPNCRCPIDKTTICAQGLPDKEVDFCSETNDTAGTQNNRRTEMSEVNETPVLFHKVPNAVVALAQTNGSYSTHDVYAYRDGRLFAKRGGSFVLLYKSKMTSLKGCRVFEFAAPFTPEGSSLGYMTLPEGYEL